MARVRIRVPVATLFPQCGSIHVTAPVSRTKQTPSAPSVEETQDGNIPLLPMQSNLVVLFATCRAGFDTR